MSNVPDGAQLSDDGNYWWDGSQWQPVEGAQQPSGADEQPPDPPTDSEIQQAWADADLDKGGTGDVAALLADTVTNTCDQICFYWRRSDGKDVLWFQAMICAPSEQALTQLLLEIVLRLRKAGYPVSYAQTC